MISLCLSDSVWRVFTARFESFFWGLVLLYVMGNWRERPRRNFRTQKPPWSAIRNYDHDPPIEYWRDGIPLWEKKFCTKIGCVPWGKIVDSKNFINCHANIVNWDDSACEEALHNAKRRYWAEINGHQCDIYPPDPDKYIENIDWSPDIDSEMIEELDLAYYAPNMTQSDDSLECKNKRTRNISSVVAEGHIKDPGHVGNPWVHSNHIKNTGQGWSQWNLSDSGKVNNDGNPWDSSVAQVNTGMVDSAWRDKAPEVVTSWKKEEFASDARGMVDSAWRDRAHQGGVTSWKTEGNASDARGMVDNAWRDEVHQGGTASWKAKGVASDARNNAWSRHQQSASNFDHYNSHRHGNNSYNRNVRNLTDRTRPSIQVNKQDWKYQYRYGKRPKDAEFGNVGW